MNERISKASASKGMSKEADKINEIKEFVDSKRAAIEEELKWAESATMENKECIVSCLRIQLSLLDEVYAEIERS